MWEVTVAIHAVTAAILVAAATTCATKTSVYDVATSIEVVAGDRVGYFSLCVCYKATVWSIAATMWLLQTPRGL